MADNTKSLEDRVSRLEAAIGPIVDPAGPWGGGGGGILHGHGPVGDPAPIDISRFSTTQLQSSLHSISAEKTRLAAMETLINQHLSTLKKS
jgi:hypothetical protein